MEEAQSKSTLNQTTTYPPQYTQPPQYGQPPGPPGQGLWVPAPVMTQPMPNLQQTSTNNTIVINNQTAAPTIQLPRPWSTGICAMCDDISVCCCVYWCEPCAWFQLSMDMGESCCLPLCVSGWLVALRTKMRTQYNIQGNILDDSTTICLCRTCVLCQMMRELKFMKNNTVIGR